ncbi:MAG TPA: DUF6090 family protein [Cyclobacteriaceae bacterium]
MSKPALKFKIEWKSKIIDLLIVIIGITIAFKLNNWNETNKTESKVQEYLKSFYDENNVNQENLVSVLEYSKSKKRDVDTLKGILLSNNYSDKRIKTLTTKLMGMANYSPIITTMQNISSSGEFDVIKDIELRRLLIDTYEAYKTTANLELLVSNYVNQYASPFLFEKIRLSDFSAIKSDFTNDPIFENIVFGYDILLAQLIRGYEQNLDKVFQLKERLTTANDVISRAKSS